MLPEYALYAVRYATRASTRSANFVGGDPHDGPMPMDYFVWAAVGPAGTFVIDCGFNEDSGQKRGRTLLRTPVDGLKQIGVDAASVEHMIVTHLHYDHVGNLQHFPNARIHIQAREVAYATGPLMRFPKLSHSFEADDVCRIVRMNYAERVSWYDGAAEIAPGISVHLAGGHSAGLQCVRVNTARGPVVLASDVAHYYENIESGRPFSTAMDLVEMLDGFDLLLQLADGAMERIVPGHDPKVMDLYPPPKPELAGIAARLDVSPSP
jgi:glyoxylase-like metal-dependent hydrolase (beta-lactamase superfamily II)